jgi:hypothetical protein
MNAALLPRFARRSAGALCAALFILLLALATVCDSQVAHAAGAPISTATSDETHPTEGLPSWWRDEDGDLDDDDDEFEDEGGLHDHEDADQLTDEERYLGTYSSMLTVPAYEGEDEEENVNEDDAPQPGTAAASASRVDDGNLASPLPTNGSAAAPPPLIVPRALKTTAVLDKTLSAIVTKCRNMYYTGGKAGSSDPQQDRPGANACAFDGLA